MSHDGTPAVASDEQSVASPPLGSLSALVPYTGYYVPHSFPLYPHVPQPFYAPATPSAPPPPPYAGYWAPYPYPYPYPVVVPTPGPPMSPLSPYTVAIAPAYLAGGTGPAQPSPPRTVHRRDYSPLSPTPPTRHVPRFAVPAPSHGHDQLRARVQRTQPAPPRLQIDTTVHYTPTGCDSTESSQSRTQSGPMPGKTGLWAREGTLPNPHVGNKVWGRYRDGNGKWIRFVGEVDLCWVRLIESPEPIYTRWVRIKCRNPPLHEIDWLQAVDENRVGFVGRYALPSLKTVALLNSRIHRLDHAANPTAAL
ncbi:hypothetical protein EXIGLDRAFT_722754 [Exidia glandulosa HHB12029]|uniref:Uncharacterized protein n=1 Tax=Exidia glandulosa HHB12029 TaxID=1314781 RepID=A0A165F4G6_EXIGL|nr:hypothetical protein EXIGLDRAFT_722754 [Exidia glandulosa HHB12029]